jgi:hypothetical protein
LVEVEALRPIQVAPDPVAVPVTKIFPEVLEHPLAPARVTPLEGFTEDEANPLIVIVPATVEMDPAVMMTPDEDPVVLTPPVPVRVIPPSAALVVAKFPPEMKMPLQLPVVPKAVAERVILEPAPVA